MARPAADKPLPQFHINQLAQLFGLDRKTVAKRLRDVAPDTQTTNGARHEKRYTIRKAAPYLVETNEVLRGAGDVDPDDLPPEDAKNYWDAKLKEQTYLSREGHLWDDETVLEAFSAVFKPLANKLRAVSDTLERRAGLNARQAGVIDEVCDELLREIHGAVAAAVGDLDEPDA